MNVNNLPRILYPRADLGDPDLKVNPLEIWNLPTVETLILSSHLLAICWSFIKGEGGIPSLAWLRRGLKETALTEPWERWHRQKLPVITAACTCGASDVPAPTQALPESKGV